MSAVAALDRVAIGRACERCGVARLRVFGSAATDQFDPRTSDFDFLVDFGPDAPQGIAPFFGLKEALAQIVGRDVDLVEANAVRNPYFAKRAFGEAVDLSAA
ncbi:nucleotidyltransferase domain-containing protein [Microbacterium sp. X-17]|uniref:nucleotidyltransferase family protein n=1 Tax=Microbacterium sp. X-17 TaxID=3144404 RepID=UPI0031F5A746